VFYGRSLLKVSLDYWQTLLFFVLPPPPLLRFSISCHRLPLFLFRGFTCYDPASLFFSQASSPGDIGEVIPFPMSRSYELFFFIYFFQAFLFGPLFLCPFSPRPPLTLDLPKVRNPLKARIEGNSFLPTNNLIICGHPPHFRQDVVFSFSLPVFLRERPLPHSPFSRNSTFFFAEFAV